MMKSRQELAEKLALRRDFFDPQQKKKQIELKRRKQREIHEQRLLQNLQNVSNNNQTGTLFGRGGCTCCKGKGKKWSGKKYEENRYPKAFPSALLQTARQLTQEDSRACWGGGCAGASSEAAKFVEGGGQSRHRSSASEYRPSSVDLGGDIPVCKERVGVYSQEFAKEAWDRANDKNKGYRFAKDNYCCRVCLKPGAKKDSDAGEKPLLRCSRCKVTYYCSVACQKQDYKFHKHWCYARPQPLNMEQCPEGKIPWFRGFSICSSCGLSHPINSPCANFAAFSPHFGNLDLMVWPFPQSQEELNAQLDGKAEDDDVAARSIRCWGGELLSKSDRGQDGQKGGWALPDETLRVIFERDFQGDESIFFERHPEAFRWSCCGANQLVGRGGCFHHGSGPFRCQCANCEKGIPSACKLKQEGVSLNLVEGPDPRSVGKKWNPGDHFDM